MPNVGMTNRFNKIPVLGLVPESSGTAPTAPAVGQLWIDTSVTPKLFKVWDGSIWAATNLYSGTTATSYAAGNDSRIVGAEQTTNKNTASGYAGLDATTKVVIAQIPTGQTGTTVPFGNDARFTDQRVPTDGSVTGGTAGAGVKIAPTTITLANLAVGLTDGTAGSQQVRALGTTATTAAAGNDARLSDTRTPTAGSVVDASVAAGAAIAESKLALASDAAAGTASRRTLGTGALQATSGTDARLSDTRTPTAGSVVDASVAAGAAIAETKLALASDAAAGTASRRTIGTGALQAMAGSTTLSSIAAPTGNVNANGFKITNLAAPTLASDAARLSDVQSAAAGIDNKPSVRLGTTANITGTATATTITYTATGATTYDGVAPALNDRVLVKNQTNTVDNGSYTVTTLGSAGVAEVLTRSTDTITANAFWFIEEGTANADTSWMVTTNGAITLGTTALTIGQFGAPGSVSGTANRITVTGGVVDIAATYVGQTSITTLGVITAGTWNGTNVGTSYGGTGAGTVLGARANLNVPQQGYAATLGSVTAGVALVVSHNLGTQDVIAQVRDASTNEYIYLDVINASANTVTITSGLAFAANALRIVVIPVA